MAFMNCPKCGMMVSDKAEVCIKCKFILSKENIEKYKSEHPIFLFSVNCPYCKKRISTKSKTCVFCEKEISPEFMRTASKRIANKGIGCISLIIILMVISYIFRDSDSSKTTIEMKPKTVVTEKSSTTTSTSLPVQNSAWDGSVFQVKQWLKDNLDDPQSVDYVDWSPVSKSDGGNWMVRVKFRAKNAYGALILNNWVFYLDDLGQVLYYKDVAGIVD